MTDPRPAMPLKYGKKPARPGAMKLKFADYVSKRKLPTPPADFGHELLVARTQWGMLGNDRAGNCVWAGADHETMMWNYERGERVTFNTKASWSDYSAVTNFDPKQFDAEGNNPTDNGTDMVEAAKYRQKIGVLDMHGKRHKIAAYLEIEPGNTAEHMSAAWVLGAVGIGIKVASCFQQQFADGQPWKASKIDTDDGHYVPLVSRRKGLLYVVTWGALQAITEPTFRLVNDESVAYVSEETLTLGKTPEGFDINGLKETLAALA